MRTLVTVGLTLASLMMVEAKKHDLSNLCKDKSIATIDESFVETNFPVGLYAVMLKKLDTLTKTDVNNVKPDDDRKWKHNACFKVSVILPTMGSIETRGGCNYNNTNHASCFGFIGNGGQKYEDLWIIKTDDKTYALLLGCTAGTDPYWFVLATNPELPEETENMLLTYLEGLGFDKKDATPEGDAGRGSKLVKVDCITPRSKGYGNGK